MKKLLAMALGALVVAQTHGSVTIDFGAAVLQTTGPAPMPVGGLVILAASTENSLFNAPLDTAFVSGDDIEIKRWALTTEGQLLTTTGPLTLSGNWTAADPLQFYWYPTLTLGAERPGAGTSYGTYRTDLVLNGSTTGWFTPSDGSLIALNFLTASAGGSLADAMGLATQTTVPEPAAFATVSGLLCLLGAIAFKARRQKTRRA